MMDEERPKPSATRDAHHAMSGWYDRLTDWGAAVERQALVMLSAREGEDIVNVGSDPGALTALSGQWGRPAVWASICPWALRRSATAVAGRSGGGGPPVRRRGPAPVARQQCRCGTVHPKARSAAS